MNKTLKPFKLYGENIDFIVNSKSGGEIVSKEDLMEFLDDNFELIELIYRYEDDLIKVGAGNLDKNEDVNHMLKKMYSNIKGGCGFDEKKYKSKDFYNLPIIEFKKLFD